MKREAVIASIFVLVLSISFVSALWPFDTKWWPFEWGKDVRLAPAGCQDCPGLKFRGDVNNDCLINDFDIHYIEKVAINGKGDFCTGGYEYYLPADVNDDGFVDEADMDYLSNWLFQGGPAPALLCKDNDGDSYSAGSDRSFCTKSELDCNDNNKNIYPGALEVCDGFDNQCSGDSGYGTVDEGCAVQKPTCNNFGFSYGVVGELCPNGVDYDLSGCYSEDTFCSDSDNGKKYYAAGVTISGTTRQTGLNCNGAAGESGGASEKSDSCNGNTLTEYFCHSNDNTGSTSFNCLSGYICSNGACIINQTGNQTNQTQPQVCGNGIKDSIYEQCDDGNLINGDGCDRFCRTEISNQTSGNVTNQTTPSNQTNQTNTCGDSDGGVVKTSRGTVSGNFSGQPYSYTDFCLTNISVLEYYCSSGLARNSTLSCIGNTTSICSNGACIIGNQTNQTGIPPANQTSYCGNRRIDAGEQCDDGNLINGDGCNRLCMIEVANQTINNTNQTGGSGPGPGGNVSNGSVGGGGIGIQPEECKLTGASWSKSETIIGDVVQLAVTGTNCEGKRVNFEVKEYDPAGIDDAVVSQPESSVFADGVARTEWIIEDQFDRFFTNPEYFFAASLLSDSSVSIESDLLRVTSVPQEEDNNYYLYCDGKSLGMPSGPVSLEEIAGGDSASLSIVQLLVSFVGKDYWCGEKGDLNDKERLNLWACNKHVESICGAEKYNVLKNKLIEDGIAKKKASLSSDDSESDEESSLIESGSPISRGGSLSEDSTSESSSDLEDSVSSTDDGTVRESDGLKIGECKLTAASWSKSEAVIGEVISLVVIGTNCAGKGVSFEVREKDYISGNDDIVNQPPVASFIDNFEAGIASSRWTIERQLDEWLTKPEYIFIARVNEQEILSGILKVS